MMKLVVSAALTLCLPGLMSGQTKPAQDVWEPFAYLLAIGKERATASLVFRRRAENIVLYSTKNFSKSAIAVNT
jgi:hypothetical protein